MKKLLIILLSMTVAGAAFAESELDSELKQFGIVDDNYVYTDLDLASSFFTTVTDIYAKSLPINFNRYIEITGMMMTPYYSNVSYRYTIPLETEDRAMIKEELSSNQSVREICEDSFISDRFMQANGFTIVYSYMDSDYRPLANVTINNAACISAFVQ